MKMSCKMKALENNGAMKQRHCNTMRCTKQTHCKKLQNKCKAVRNKQNNDIAKHKAKDKHKLQDKSKRDQMNL